MGCGGSKQNKEEDKSTLNNKSGILIQSSQFVRRNMEDFNKNYKLGELLGRGSFGKVYKVLHHPTNQLRAMKVINKDKIKSETEKTLEKEIVILSQLDHPNIIKIFEYFESEKTYQIIQELANGGELFDKINEIQVFNENCASIIMEQLLSSVTYMHSKNIVHRDLKPENILLENKNLGDYSIKLIDFGTAHILKSKNEKISVQIGTAYYMAPEILSHKYDEKCDIWSCGVILYILLCGYPPFHGGENEDDDSILASVKKGKFSMDGREWDNVSKEAKTFIKKMLIYDSNKRPTAEVCMKDPWIQKYKKEIKVKVDINSRLSLIDTHKLTSKHKLQQASIAFIVHQMSTNEIAKNLRVIFKQMDESGDGKLSYTELKNGWKKYFKDSISEVEFDKLIESMDQDNNNYIEYEEFLRATINQEIVLSEKNLEMAFNFFDKDKSGKLSAEEIKNVLGIAIDDPNSNAIIKQILKDVDTNGDGEVSFEEFKVLMIHKLKA